MDLQSPKTDPNRADGDGGISASGKFLMCFFLLVFVGFGVILLGDLLSGLWR